MRIKILDEIEKISDILDEAGHYTVRLEGQTSYAIVTLDRLIEVISYRIFEKMIDKEPK